MAMLTVRVDSENIADLTNAATLRVLGSSRAELTGSIIDKGRGDSVPQILGRAAYDTGKIDGLLVWSRVSTRDKNLVLFPDRLGLAYDLHDPTSELPSIHPTIMEAMNVLMGIE